MRKTLKHYKTELESAAEQDAERIEEIQRLDLEIRQQQEDDALRRARLDGAWA